MSGTSSPPPHAAATKLAQLLGETIVHHAPWTSEIDARTRQRVTDEWLEGLEQHTAGFVGPFLQHVLDNSDPPEPVRVLLGEAIAPTAQFSSLLEQIFLYGIVSQIIGASVQPFLQGLTNDLNQAAVSDGISRPPDPSIIATAAGRGLNLGDPPTVNVPDWAYKQAAENGLNSATIDLMASLIGLPPALQELFELYRRGVITIDQVKVGLREGDFRDDWIDQVVQLAHGWLTPLDFVRAAVQSQMTYSDAAEWATKTGLDTSTPLPMDTAGTEASPDMFGLAFSIAGRPPGPVQLADMAHRGIIGWEGTGANATTFQQGIAESDVKTKWTGPLRALSAYLPPPGTIGTLLERGAITKDQAVTLWEQRGVPTALAEGYAYMAEQQHVGQDKLLARSDITTGYFDGLFSKDQAMEMLGLLGYRDDVADEILAVTAFRREIQAINAAAKRIESLYTAYKLTPARSREALITIGIAPDQADRLLTTWEAVRVQPIRLPTTRDIGLAVKAGTITEAEGLQELADLGYQPRDAAIVLSAYSKLPVKPLPPRGESIVG